MKELLTSASADENDVRNFLDHFFNTYLIAEDLQGASKNVDEAGLSYQLQQLHLGKAPAENVLRSFLLVDHGLANDLDHGTAADSGTHLLDAKLRKFESVQSAIQVVGWSEKETDNRSYLLKNAKSMGLGLMQQRRQHLRPPTYVAIFGFRDIPHDVLMLYVNRSSQQWKIERFYWLAF
ncbi:MAG: hypothetical protein WAN65_29290 [Candidatus Sulfotelmatobacter sp.]